MLCMLADRARAVHIVEACFRLECKQMKPWRKSIVVETCTRLCVEGFDPEEWIAEHPDHAYNKPNES